VAKQTKLDVGSGKGRTINPDLEQWYAKQAHMVAGAGASHSVYVSHPKEVSDVIESAAVFTTAD
jgi:hypothetical protein